jgi:hypothetical protein
MQSMAPNWRPSVSVKLSDSETVLFVVELKQKPPSPVRRCRAAMSSLLCQSNTAATLPADAVISVAAPIECKTLPAFDCISAKYVGPMHRIGDAWRQVADAWRASGSGESREVYKQWIGFDSLKNVTELQKGIAG